MTAYDPGMRTSSEARIVAGLEVGSAAVVRVPVAGGWRSADAPREIDRLAVSDTPDVGRWLARLDDDRKRDLVGRLDTQLILGELVIVMELAGGWARVVIPGQPSPEDPRGYPAWIPQAQLAPADDEAAAAADLRAGSDGATVATIIDPTTALELEDGPEWQVSFGTRLPVVAVDDELVTVELPDGTSGRLSAASVVVHEPRTPALSPSTSSILATARRFIGLPYLWAGTSGFGFDCSGLVHLVHRVHGVTLPRDTGPQSLTGAPVDPDARQPGDLVFFERNGDVHHVVTWLGDGQVIESPRTGQSIRVITLDALPYASEVTVTRRPNLETPR